MIERRPFASLGGADHGWLRARHHFSFAGYRDPARTGWGAIRVWNDDEIAPGTGFPAHHHADMEIVTYVREGAITHEDSLGNRGRTEAGDVQVMSAGTGIRHAERNLEPGRTTLFQIWIEPRAAGLRPSWGTRRFPRAGDGAGFVTLASGLAADSALADAPLPINAEARVSGATLAAGARVRVGLDPARRAYLVPARGTVEIAGADAGMGEGGGGAGAVRLSARDGAAIAGETALAITAIEDCELVLVDAA